MWPLMAIHRLHFFPSSITAPPLFILVFFSPAEVGRKRRRETDEKAASSPEDGPAAATKTTRSTIYGTRGVKRSRARRGVLFSWLVVCFSPHVVVKWQKRYSINTSTSRYNVLVEQN